MLRVRNRVETLLGALRVRRRRLQRGRALVGPEIEAADEAANEHRQRQEQPEKKAPDGRGESALGRRRLPVERDRRQRSRREDRVAVAVDGGAATDSSLQRRPHGKGRAGEALAARQDSRAAGRLYARDGLLGEPARDRQQAATVLL